MGDSTTRTVATIGLGRMGGPIADHVIDAGFDVRAYDIAPDAVRARVERGARAATSVAEACADAQVVCVTVLDDAQAIAVIGGTGGALDVLRPGSVVALHSTVTIDTIEELGRQAASRGVHFLDAGISGGEHGARAGTLITMVGGTDEAVALARPVIEAYSRELVHAGPLGAGMAVKLARNAAGYILMAAAHEALLLTDAAGVDPAVLRHVLESTQMETMLYTPFVIGGPSPFPADVEPERRDAMVHTYRLAAKDLQQALALAERHGRALPAAVATLEEFAAVVRVGQPPA